MTKVKICGITQKEDAHRAIDFGVDSLGFVFYNQSKRFVTPKQIEWINHLPAFVQITGLFVNQSLEHVESICNHLAIDILQFHGDESGQFCEEISKTLSKRYIRAVPMQNFNASQALSYMLSYHNCSGFLLDNYGDNSMGGSGHTFNWKEIPKNIKAPLILAGGININNIKFILSNYQPYAVDLSTAVELSPGVKCPHKMASFIQAVKQHDIETLKK